MGRCSALDSAPQGIVRDAFDPGRKASGGHRSGTLRIHVVISGNPGPEVSCSGSEARL